MRIEHFKATNMAMAPDEIVRATNEFTEHEAFLNEDCLPNIYHFHNRARPDIPYAPNQVIQYHSEPGRRVDLRFPGPKITLAQYHCLQPEYQDCYMVRNIIPIHDPLCKPAYPRLKKIKVGYSPSHTNEKITGPFDKGLTVTRAILEKVRKDKPKLFDYDIIAGVKPDECMARKNRCNVIIDEVVTESYHKCTLEGLALGKATICSMSQDMEAILLDYAPRHPILNVWGQDLEDYLHHMIAEGPLYARKIGVSSRQWMETYWRPQDLIQEYLAIYQEVLDGSC